MIYTVIGLSLVVVTQFIFYRISQGKERESNLKWFRESSREHIEDIKSMSNQFKGLQDGLAVERQQLLDRIQAPTFAEYKTQEVRVIKAQAGEKEPVKLEVM